jgi:hypothetical protein
MSKQYNGHKDLGHWNVSLWICNDEPLYRFAIDCIRGAKRDQPNRWLTVATIRFCESMGNGRTPDGFNYTRQRVRAALEGLES